MVVTVHDLVVFDVGGASGSYYSWLTRWAMRNADVIVCVSASTAAAVAGTGLARVEPRVIPWGPSLPVGHPASTPTSPSRRPYMLYSGGYHPRKGLDWLISTWRALRLERSFDLVLTGNPPPELRSLPSTACVGTVANDVLSNLVDEASAVLYPSSLEGFGFPILDGVVRGRPVVCRAHVGIVDDLPAGSVLAVETREQFAEAVKAVASNSWSPSIAAAGQAERTFSWHRAAVQYVDVYRGVLGRGA